MKKHHTLRLVETRRLDRKQWLDIRQRGIGSSDAAASVGLCPYKSQLELWMEKTGRSPASDDAPGQDDPRYWGTLLEPLVATAYQARTGHKVRKCNAVLQHPTFPYMLANIDREIVGVPGVRILECKTAGEFGSRLWNEGVPEYIQLQVQHQLAITGIAAAEVAVLRCGQKLDVYRITRDEDIISRLIVLEARFWECVVNDVEPPADGSESAARALRSLYPGRDETVDFSQDADLTATFTELVTVNATLKVLEARAEELKQTLQQAMGNASRARFGPAGEIFYRRSKDGTTLDTQRLSADHPDLAVAYTVTKPGTRRFRINTDIKETPHA